MAPGQTPAPLFNAGGAARRLLASPLFALGPSAAGPALRRGALVAVPVGLALAVELGVGTASKGAIGTAVGLVIATALSVWLHDYGFALAAALAIATAFSYGMLTVQYALFTAAITTYAVLLADTLGEPALRAAGQRAGATVLGIVIAALAFLLWPNPGEGRRGVAGPLQAESR